MESEESACHFQESAQGKPDRVFDLSSPTAFPKLPYTGGNPLIFGMLSALIQSRALAKFERQGRYFYYTPLTARIARTGAAGSEAYRYSLDDPHADPRRLTKEELASLSLPMRLAVRWKGFVFASGAVILLVIAGYIARQYVEYEDLTPCLLIIPSALGMVLWLRLINTAEGSTLEMLPNGVMAFGESPTLPQWGMSPLMTPGTSTKVEI